MKFQVCAVMIGGALLLALGGCGEAPAAEDLPARVSETVPCQTQPSEEIHSFQEIEREKDGIRFTFHIEQNSLLPGHNVQVTVIAENGTGETLTVWSPGNGGTTDEAGKKTSLTIGLQDSQGNPYNDAEPIAMTAAIYEGSWPAGERIEKTVTFDTAQAAGAEAGPLSCRLSASLWLKQEGTGETGEGMQETTTVGVSTPLAIGVS